MAGHPVAFHGDYVQHFFLLRTRFFTVPRLKNLRKSGPPNTAAADFLPW